MRLATQAVPDGLDHRPLLFPPLPLFLRVSRDFWVAFPITVITRSPDFRPCHQWSGLGVFQSPR